MHITLRDALSIHPMSKAKLVAGAEGSSRIIKFINVMDRPEQADTTKHGELLFTSAFTMNNKSYDVIQLIKKLNENGASGLGIKLGLFWSSIPESLIECANSFHFPLLELPFQYDLSDQIQALYHAEYERNSKTLHTVLEKQKLLLQYALKRDDIANIIRIIETILGHPIAVVGSRGHLFYNSTKWDVRELLKGWPWHNKVQWVNELSGRYLRYPLMQYEENLGFLLIAPEEWTFVQTEEGLYKQAAEILSFHLGFSYLSFLETTLQDDINTKMSRYVKGKTSLEDVLETARRTGIILCTNRYKCTLISIRNFEGDLHQSKVLKEIRQELLFDPRLQSLNGKHFFIQEGIFSIYDISPQGNGSGSHLQDILEKHFSGFAAQKDDRQVVHILFSNAKESPYQLLESFHECKQTLELAERFQLLDLTLHYETIEYHYLFQFIPEHVMREYVEKTLQPVFSKGEDQAAELLNTLAAFLDNDGRMSGTAKQLFMHRNSVSYRLDKISELLQLDMKNMGHLLKLKIILLFRQILSHQTSK